MQLLAWGKPWCSRVSLATTTRGRWVEILYPRVDFWTPKGYIFRPLYSLGLRAIRVVGFAAELTVHDGSYRLLNVQLFLLATPGTLVVQAFPEGESQTHSRRTRNHSMMVQAKHLQRDQE